jgi:hypothetical protein
MEPLVQFAIALAAALKSAFPSITIGETVVPVTAQWEPQPDVAMESADLTTPTIWTIGMAETLGMQAGDGIEEFQVLAIVQCKIAPTNRRGQVSALGLLAANAARKCRQLAPDQTFVLSTDYAQAVCTRVERNPAVNLFELRLGLFYSELLTTWKVC